LRTKKIDEKRYSRKFIRNFAVGVLVAGHTAKTVRRNLDWSDEESIFLSGLTVNAKETYQQTILTILVTPFYPVRF
jgi:hypothetical protein